MLTDEFALVSVFTTGTTLSPATDRQKKEEENNAAQLQDAHMKTVAEQQTVKQTKNMAAQ